jgi:DNA-binding FadR family transcriptional regulator
MRKSVAPGSQRKSAEIAERIRELVLTRGLRPGERLPPERELAQEFNVSRTALREALLLLESQGFLSIRRGRHGGAFVQNTPAKSVAGAFEYMLRLGQVSIEQLLQARLGIELMLPNFLGEAGRERWIEQLARNVAEAERLAGSAATPDVQRALLENLHEFHRIFAAATNNPVFMLASDTIVGIISSHMTEAGHAGCVSVDSVAEHRVIFDAVNAGKLEQPRLALEVHLNADNRRTRAVLQRAAATRTIRGVRGKVQLGSVTA